MRVASQIALVALTLSSAYAQRNLRANKQVRHGQRLGPLCIGARGGAEGVSWVREGLHVACHHPFGCGCARSVGGCKAAPGAPGNDAIRLVERPDGFVLARRCASWTRRRTRPRRPTPTGSCWRRPSPSWASRSRAPCRPGGWVVWAARRGWCTPWGRGGPCMQQPDLRARAGAGAPWAWCVGGMPSCKWSMV
jgi:hypothetical protein